MRRLVLFLVFLSAAVILVVMIVPRTFWKNDAENVICSNYPSGTECVNDINCKPVYSHEGPNFDQTGMPLNNKVFLSCENRKVEDVEILIRNRTICEKQGATWLYDFANCSCPRSIFPDIDEGSAVVFVKDKGCRTSKDICEDRGGVWTKHEIEWYLPYCLINGVKTDVGERDRTSLLDS